MKLIGLAIEQIYNQKLMGWTAMRQQKAAGKKITNLSLENFKELVKSYESERKKCKGKNEAFPSPEAKKLMAKIQCSAEEVFAEIKRLKEEKSQAEAQLEKIEEIETKLKYELPSKYNEHDDWEYLLPLHDTNVITNIIKKKSNEEIIKTIKEEKIRYIKATSEFMQRWK